MFDFLLHYEEKGFYDDEILSLGGEIFILPRLKPKNLFKYIFKLNTFFKKHKNEYDILHGHLTSVGVIYLLLAKLHGIKTTIIHAHYTDTKGNKYAFLERLMLFPLRFCADYYFACSDSAAVFCYGKNILKKPNYYLIKNGVDIEKFHFNASLREEKRKAMNIGNRFVLLHAGRFEKQKNHLFLLEIMKVLSKDREDIILLLAGQGSLKEEIETEVKKLNLCENIIFLGSVNDMNSLMQAADLFLLPSIFEGLPVSAIEAQTASLTCLLSENITSETDITGNCIFLPINDPFIWSETIIKNIENKREDLSDKIKDSGYDIISQTKALESFYLDCIKSKNL